MPFLQSVAQFLILGVQVRSHLRLAFLQPALLFTQLPAPMEVAAAAQQPRFQLAQTQP